MTFNVTSAKYVADYKIAMTFEDGSSGVADLSEFVIPDTVFAPFSDLEFFKNFEAKYGTLVWGENEEVDQAPEKLYELATGKAFSYERHRHAV